MKIFLLAAALLSDDWTQWRGPNRDGESALAVKSWPDQLAPKWRIAVGEGHSSPVFGGGKIYSFARQNNQEIVRAIDPSNGKVIWQQSYAAPYEMNSAATSHGKGPKSTPTYDNGRLYTFGISGILTCWDATNGKPLWKNEFKQFKATSPDFGTAMSPIIYEGAVIVHAGGPGQGALAALDAASGKSKWMYSWKDDGPAYASPVVATIGGVPHLITQSAKNVMAIDARNSQFLWRIPFMTAYDQNSVTPVVRGDTLIYSGLNNGVVAVRIVKKNNEWITEQLWKNDSVAMYMNSPVWRGDLLCGLSHKNKGQFFCLNSTNGQTLWTSPGRQGDNAAMILTKDHILALNTDGKLVVIDMQGKEFRPVKTYDAAKSATWAHPAIVPGGILVKDFDSLAFLPL